MQIDSRFFIVRTPIDVFVFIDGIEVTKLVEFDDRVFPGVEAGVADLLRSEGLLGPKRAEEAPGFARRRADKRSPKAERAD